MPMFQLVHTVKTIRGMDQIVASHSRGFSKFGVELSHIALAALDQWVHISFFRDRREGDGIMHRN